MKKAIRLLAIILSLSISFTLSAESALELNGTGKRQATIFKINVYEAKLYLENKSSDPSEIINSTENKRLTLTFLRDVSKDQINEAWQDGFENNSEVTKKLQDKLSLLKSKMTDVKKNDQLTFYWHEAEVEVFLNSISITKIPGKDFQKALLRNWLGDSPPNKSLKTGLLGK